MLSYIIIGILMIFVVSIVSYVSYITGYRAGYNENREELAKLKREKNRKRFQVSFTDLKNQQLDFPNSSNK